ncbi:MAG: mannosyltransferase family protein [Vicinamibacterales bacterium]
MSESAPVRSTSSSSAVVPAWVTTADSIVVALLLVAVIVAEWGGFRTAFWSVRVAVTSPWRVLAVALVALGIRHALFRQPAIHQSFPTGLRRALSTASARASLIAVLGTRPAILFVAFFALQAFGYFHEQPPVRFSEDEVINLQGRWDASWYMDIATQGYRFHADDPTAQQNVVFFPAFPMALRMVGRLFGGSVAAHLFGGTALNIVIFFFALVYLYRLTRDLVGDEGSAASAAMLTATYPFAFFFSAIYTESTFLLCAVAVFYHARRGEFAKSSVWGLIVGLTRPNGCFLSIPLLLVTAAPWLPRWLHAPWGSVDRSSGSEVSPAPRTLGRLAAAFATAAAPGIGVLLYCAFVWQLTGNPIAWAEGQGAWGRQYVGLWSLVKTWYGFFQESGVYVVTHVLPFDTLNGLGALFVLGWAIPVWRRLGLPYMIVILVNMLPPLAAGGFLSAGRLSSVMFPVFICMAAVIPARQRPAWSSTFMAIQALNTAFFYTWHELF